MAQFEGDCVETGAENVHSHHKCEKKRFSACLILWLAVTLLNL